MALTLALSRHVAHSLNITLRLDATFAIMAAMSTKYLSAAGRKLEGALDGTDEGIVTSRDSSQLTIK